MTLNSASPDHEVTILGSTILLLILLTVCCFGPGYFIARRLRLGLDEKLTLAIALSLIILYLAAFTIYCTGLSWKMCWVCSAIFLVATIGSWRDLASVMHRRSARRALGAFALLLAAGLLLLSVTRHYSGAEWAVDWLEHFRRAEFFLNRLPYDTQFGSIYALPARPPMMNLISAHFLAHVGDRYELFQVTSVFLSTLVLFPCVMLARMLGKPSRATVWWMAFFLGTSPLFLVNATWTWTKLLATFFVLVSVAFYLRGWTKQSALRIVIAAGAMAAAMLVHYSAGPYAVFFAFHYLLIARQRRSKLREILGSATTGAVLLTTWFGWCLAIYGPAITFGSNTTVTGSQSMGWQANLYKVGFNLFATLVPHPLRISPRSFEDAFIQPNSFGYVRDYFFLLYQQNLLFSLGLIGWAAVAMLAWRAMKTSERSLRYFWIGLIATATLLGVAAVGEPDRNGVAHICLQPLTLIGLSLLAGRFRLLRPAFQLILLIGLAIDVGLGVLLQFRMQSLAIHFATVGPSDIIPLSNGLLNVQAVRNSLFRMSQGLPFFGDHFTSIQTACFIAIAVGFAIAFYLAARAAFSRSSSRAFIAPGIALLVLLISASLLFDRQAGYAVAAPRAARATPTGEEIQLLIAPAIQLLQANSESADAQYSLARLYYENGKHDLAVTRLKDALLLDPDHRRGTYLLRIYELLYQLRISADDAFADIYLRKFDQDTASRLKYAAELRRRGFPFRAARVTEDAARKDIGR